MIRYILFLSLFLNSNCLLPTKKVYIKTPYPKIHGVHNEIPSIPNIKVLKENKDIILNDIKHRNTLIQHHINLINDYNSKFGLKE